MRWVGAACPGACVRAGGRWWADGAGHGTRSDRESGRGVRIPINCEYGAARTRGKSQIINKSGDLGDHVYLCCCDSDTRRSDSICSMAVGGVAEDKKPKFDGNGFSKDEFSPEERAKQRHMIHFLEREFLSYDDLLKKSGLEELARAISGLPALLKFAGWIAAGAAIISAAVKAGMFG